MPYVNLNRRSGLGLITRTDIIKKMAEIIKREAATPAVITPVIPTGITPVIPTVAPLVRPSVTTQVRVDTLQLKKPTLIQLPVIRPLVPLILQMRRPSGATYRATDVEVIPGADPVSAAITDAGAPTTGQSISLKESDPIVTVTPTARGITLVDEPVSLKMPPTFVEAAAIEKRAWMKYGLLALGAYIIYDSFVKKHGYVRPKRRRLRRYVGPKRRRRRR